MPRNANQSKQSNYSMQLDGSTSAIVISSDFGLTASNSSFTFSSWINFDSVATSGFFAALVGSRSSLRGPFAINFYGTSSGMTTSFERYYGTTQIYSSVYNTTAGLFNYSTNTWYHLAIVYDGPTKSVSVYVDGTQAGSTYNLNVTSTKTTHNEITIGLYSGSGTGFPGKIDGVSIFDYKLSPSQVTTLWGGGTSVSNPMALPSPPIAYYPLGTSAWNGEYLAENNAIGDYVFDFVPSDDVNAGHMDFFDSSTTLSISGWFNFDDISVNRDLMSQWVGNTTNGSFSLRRSSGNLLALFVRTGGSSSGSDYYYANLATSSTGHSVGVWYHLAVTLDNGTCLIYLNGQALTTSTGGSPQTTLQTSTADFKLGYWQTSTTTFNGKMSNIKLWSSKLEATEIETLYNYGSPIRTLANIPQSSNLKAWYKLDASEVYNNTSTEWSIDNNQNPSAYASSLDFDGTDDSINVGTGNILTGVYSVSMWIKRTATSGGDSSQALFSKDNTSTQRSFNNYLDQSSGTLKMWQSANGSSLSVTQSSTAITDTNWHHVVYINPGSSANCQMYLDGTEVSYSSQNAGVSSIHTSAIDNMIGGHYIATSYQFYGSISNVSVWNTNLTSVQITEIYNNGTPSNLSSHSATSSLISWWKLNNTTTGIEDSKGSNNGTNNGATEYTGFVSTLNGESSGMSQANLVQSDLQTVAPYSKYALDFDSASSDAITLGNTIGNGFTQITCSIWANISTSGLTQSSYRNFLVKFPSGSGDATPFELRSNNGNRTDSYNNKLFFRINTNTGSYGFTDAGFEFTEANKWYHLVGTYDGSNVKLFVDGVEYYSISASGTLNSNNNNATIGKSGSTGNFNGKLSNASIWNTALTSAQVTELYNEGLPGNLNSHSAYSNLVSWWQLGENSSFDGNNWICS